MRVFMSLDEAKNAGAYQSMGAEQTWRLNGEAIIIRTHLEAQLAKALAEVEQEGRDEENHAICPSCAQPVKYWPSPDPGLKHNASCTLAAALKAFRGQP